jgi:hypothetical protein
MPYKGVTPQKPERILKESAQMNQGRNELSWIYIIILIIAIMFALNVTYETYDNMSNKFTVTDRESKNCLMEFQKNNCNLLNLSDEC